MLKLRYSKQFKKDFKLSQKRGLPMQKLKTILEKLVNGIPLEEKHHDHPLSGNYTSFRECHIEPDWLLIDARIKIEQVKVRISHSPNRSIIEAGGISPWQNILTSNLSWMQSSTTRNMRS